MNHSLLFAGAALYKKDAERSLQDIETSLLVCAQQCALDDEEEVGALNFARTFAELCWSIVQSYAVKWMQSSGCSQAAASILADSCSKFMLAISCCM
jgi:hypothetical protein